MPGSVNRAPVVLLAAVVLALVSLAGYRAYRWFFSSPPGNRYSLVGNWLSEAPSHPEWAVEAGERCGTAPFLQPTSGFIGFLWDDSFRPGHRHPGIDIFGGAGLNQTPVVAAYQGYLTRQEDWKSAVIIRLPADPRQPERQIWTYYTHMADSDGNSFISPEFPPGTQEEFVAAGTLLGYQGNYSGDPGNPVGIHLHFSIVLDDGQGRFLNELEFNNTLDPSRYLGLPLNARVNNAGEIAVCEPLEASNE